MKRGRWHWMCWVPAQRMESFPPASLEAVEPQPKARTELEPRQQTRERSPCSGPASLSKAAAVSTGKRFELNQNKDINAKKCACTVICEGLVSQL